MNRYRQDPRWIAARYAGQCAKCGESFPAGAQVFFYPKGRKVYVGQCAQVCAAEFNAAASDEDFYGGCQ